MMMGQQGAGLLVALMIAQHAQSGPAEQPGVKSGAPAPLLIASAQMDTAGAFRRLTPYDQRVARGLLEAEKVGAGPAWSLDKIAAARASGKEWESIIAEMQDERLVAAGDPKSVLRGRAAPGGSEQFSDVSVASGPGPKAAKRAGEQIAAANAKPDMGCAVKVDKLDGERKTLVDAQ
jgi:hypothetical protein